MTAVCTTHRVNLLELLTERTTDDTDWTGFHDSLSVKIRQISVIRGLFLGPICALSRRRSHTSSISSFQSQICHLACRDRLDRDAPFQHGTAPGQARAERSQ